VFSIKGKQKRVAQGLSKRNVRFIKASFRPRRCRLSLRFALLCFSASWMTSYSFDDRTQAKKKNFILDLYVHLFGQLATNCPMLAPKSIFSVQKK
jgi:hypothetical protein